jgi:hypothetical protein
MEIAYAISYESTAGIFMRRTCCELHDSCFHFVYLCHGEDHVIFPKKGNGKTGSCREGKSPV